MLLNYVKIYNLHICFKLYLRKWIKKVKNEGEAIRKSYY